MQKNVHNQYEMYMTNANQTLAYPTLGLALGTPGFAFGLSGFALGLIGYLDTNLLVSAKRNSRIGGIARAKPQRKRVHVAVEYRL